jgi:hypothetical protein
LKPTCTYIQFKTNGHTDGCERERTRDKQRESDAKRTVETVLVKVELALVDAVDEIVLVIVVLPDVVALLLTDVVAVELTELVPELLCVVVAEVV